MSDDSKSTLPMTRRQLLGTAAAGAAVAASSSFPTPALAGDKVLKIGYLSPRSGPFAPFAEADVFLLDKMREALKDGIENNGTNYKVVFLDADDQSNPDQATSVVQKMINSYEVNLVLAQGALTINNVSAQCEAAGIPSITTMTPWQAWMFPLGGKPDTGFEYSNFFFWGSRRYHVHLYRHVVWPGHKQGKWQPAFPMMCPARHFLMLSWAFRQR